MNTLFKSTLLAIALFMGSCNPSAKKDPSAPADTIYFGGEIITMEGDSARYAEAVVVKDGKIIVPHTFKPEVVHHATILTSCI
jgi:hypothetical protein